MTGQMGPISNLTQQFGIICFRVSGEAIGQCVACVTAASIDVAKARLEPLYHDCTLTPLMEENQGL